MSQKEMAQRYQSWEVANTWNMARDISERLINDEPLPGMKEYPKDKHKPFVQKPVRIVRNTLFSKLQRLKDDHVRPEQ